MVKKSKCVCGVLFGLVSADVSPYVEQAVVTSKPWSVIHHNTSETSDEWLNTVSGSVLLHHHPPEGEESWEEGEDSEHEKEEFYVGQELEEEVLIGVPETENDEMSDDERMEEGKPVNWVKDGGKEKEKTPENVTDFVATFSEGTWEDEEAVRGNMSVYITAAEMDSSFRGDGAKMSAVK